MYIQPSDDFPLKHIRSYDERLSIFHFIDFFWTRAAGDCKVELNNSSSSDHLVIAFEVSPLVFRCYSKLRRRFSWGMATSRRAKSCRRQVSIFHACFCTCIDVFGIQIGRSGREGCLEVVSMVMKGSWKKLSKKRRFESCPDVRKLLLICRPLASRSIVSSLQLFPPDVSSYINISAQHSFAPFCGIWWSYSRKHHEETSNKSKSIKERLQHPIT